MTCKTQNSFILNVIVAIKRAALFKYCTTVSPNTFLNDQWTTYNM